MAESSPLIQIETRDEYDFEAVVEQHGLNLAPLRIDTLQINITKLCNQACLHCHVDSSPKRTEQ
ncbi:MAG TPA: hypothetical protein ENJ29_10295, partial [Bacteroidetes bacterium]|nr:hypothetical protein [Bacteroidota bacterium]